MKHRRALRLLRTPWLSAWLLMAMLCYALIPAGFMPGPNGLMLCPGYDAPVIAAASMHDMPGMDMSRPLRAAHGANEHFSGHHVSAACPFAAAAFANAPPPDTVFCARLAPVIMPADCSRDTFTPRSIIAPSPLPRGPPLLT